MLTNISLSISEELLNKIDKKRGDVPRSRFVNRLLELTMTGHLIRSHVGGKNLPVDNSFEAKDQQVVIARGAD